MGRSESAKRAAAATRAAAAAEDRTVRVRALDPVEKCGPDTSVEFLYRVDEVVNGRRNWHLVFYDRHGWYCEHGRDCVAVRDARRFGAHNMDRRQR